MKSKEENVNKEISAGIELSDDALFNVVGGVTLHNPSGGLKVNMSSDDSSGFQIAERMRVQIRALDQANYGEECDLFN